MRSLIIRWLLGKNITVFVKEKGSGIYEIEVADSKNRKKLVVCEVQKLTTIRYRLVCFHSTARGDIKDEKAVAETTTYETIEEDLGNGRVRIYKQEIKSET